MLDYDFDIMSIVLGLSLGYFKFDLWVYVEQINDVMMIYTMTWRYSIVSRYF